MKRGTFLILSFLLVACFAQLDTSLDGDLKTIADATLPLPKDTPTDLSVKPDAPPAVTDLNATAFFTLNSDSTKLTATLEAETNALNELKTKLSAWGFKLESVKALKDHYEDIFNKVKDGLDANLKDSALIARDVLENILARYRKRKLAKIIDWMSTHADFGGKLEEILTARVDIVTSYQSAFAKLDAVVKNNCAGLTLTGIPCTYQGLLSNLAVLASVDPSIQTTMDEIKAQVDNLKALADQYASEIQSKIADFTNDDADDSDDVKVFDQVRQALKDRRTNDLPTWSDVLTKLTNFLKNTVDLKNLIEKLLDGYAVQIDVTKAIEVSTTPAVLDSTTKTASITVKFTAVSDGSIDVTAAVDKFKAVVKALLQLYAAVDKLSVDVTVGANGLVTVTVTLNSFDIQNARDLAKLVKGVELNATVLSNVKAELDSFVAGLNGSLGDLATVKQEVQAKLAQLKLDYEAANDDAQAALSSQLQKYKDFIATGDADLTGFTGDATKLATFATTFAQRLISTYAVLQESLNAALQAAIAAVKESDANVQQIKDAILTLQVQLDNVTLNVDVTDAIKASIERQKTALEEALKDRELKKAAVEKATKAIAALQTKAESQSAELLANIAKIAAGIKTKLSDVKAQLKNRLADLPEDVKNALKGYRDSVVDVTVSSSDINDAASTSLTFTVSINDNGVSGELDVARRAKHIAMLKAFFASLTTDTDISVAVTKKRATTDTYNVQSGTPPPPPSGGTTDGALSTAISFLALFAGIIMLLF